MELTFAEIAIIDEALKALIKSHEKRIEDIKNFDESAYENKFFSNKFREIPLTLEDFKKEETEYEKKRIKEALEFKVKFLLESTSEKQGFLPFGFYF